MKRRIFIIIILISSLVSYSFDSAYSALSNGQVILKENENEIVPLASLTKVMTALVVLDEVDKGNITLDDLVKIDSRVNVGESSIPLSNNDRISVSDLLNAALVYSANNAAYALALYVSKDEDSFVKLMNKKATDLRMYNTTYYTSTGLPTRYTRKKIDVSTAKDQYILAREAMKDKRIREIANKKSIKIKGSYFRNRNKILGKNGNIGLKTGYHAKAGFNMIGVFNVSGTDLIVVTLGDDSLRERFLSQLEISSRFIDSLYKIYSKDELFENVEIKHTKEGYVRTRLERDFYYYKKDGFETKIILDKNISKIKKGDKIGVLRIFEDSKLIDEINIISEDDTSLLSVWGLVKTWF